jgi:esterase/lipase
MGTLKRAAALLLALFAAAAFAAEGDGTLLPHSQKSFEAYAQDARAYVEANRRWVTEGALRAAELEANLPHEYMPEHPDGRAILLVHGLGDSPFTFDEIARDLAKEGILVRTVLLPGCGTKPADMMKVTQEDWRRTVEEQAGLLRARSKSFWIGGYSMGGDLAIDYAARHPGEVKGLVLFSPAAAVRSRLAALAVPASHVRDWITAPEERPNGGQNPLQYLITPTKGLAAFYRTMTAAQEGLEKLEKDRWRGRWFAALAARDGLVKTEALLPQFQRIAKGTRSAFLWYGTFPKGADAAGTRALPDAIGELKIAGFSHMALTYSERNPFYGKQGTVRFCWNGQGKAESLACEKGADVCFSGDGQQPEGAGGCAKLTWNPYYGEQLKAILSVMAEP